MAGAHEFYIHCDHVGVVLDALSQALQSQGFSVMSTPSGGLLAKRGSAAKTFWLGAMAGKDFHITLDVELRGTLPDLVARLNRNMAGSALKGGAFGASFGNQAFQSTANAIAAELDHRGILISQSPA